MRKIILPRGKEPNRECRSGLALPKGAGKNTRSVNDLELKIRHYRIEHSA